MKKPGQKQRWIVNSDHPRWWVTRLDEDVFTTPTGTRVTADYTRYRYHALGGGVSEAASAARA